MKKILVLLLAALLLAAPLSISVSAAKTPTFVVSSAKGEAGDTVKITISTKENTGIISMKMLLKYDSKALMVVDSENGKFKGVAFSPKESNPFVVNWIDPLSPNNKENGVVATITFQILDTAPNGKSEITLSYNPNDVFDSDFNNVEFAVENGYVDITNQNPVSQPDDASSQNTSSDVMIDTTGSQILEQAQNSANQDNSNQDLPDQPKNDWITWVVVAGIVSLIGVLAFFVIKGNK